MLFFGTIVVFHKYQKFTHRNFVGTTFKMIESIVTEFTNSEKEFWKHIPTVTKHRTNEIDGINCRAKFQSYQYYSITMQLEVH